MQNQSGQNSCKNFTVVCKITNGKIQIGGAISNFSVLYSEFCRWQWNSSIISEKTDEFSNKLMLKFCRKKSFWAQQNFSF